MTFWMAVVLCQICNYSLRIAQFITKEVQFKMLKRVLLPVFLLTMLSWSDARALEAKKTENVEIFEIHWGCLCRCCYNVGCDVRGIDALRG